MREKHSTFRDKVSQDTQRQKREASSYGYLKLPKDVKIFNPEADERAYLNFIPYEVTDSRHPDRNTDAEIAIPGTLWYKRPFKIHRNVGSSNESVVCPTSFGKPCPICEERTRMIKDGKDKEDTAALRASSRNLYVVIPINNKKLEATPHIWDISQYCFQDLLNEELEEKEDNAVFPDAEKGKTLKIRFEELKINKNKFLSASRIDFEDRDESYDEDFLKDIPNLDEVLNLLPYKEIESKFFELDNEEKAEEVVEEPTRKRKEIPEREELKTNVKRQIEKSKEPELDDLTWSNLQEMGQSKLNKLINSNKELEDIDPEDYDDDVNALRKEIAKVLDIEIPQRIKQIIKTDSKEKDDDDEKEVTKKPALTRNKPVTHSNNKCPSGFEFGKDWGEKKQCDTCDKFDECGDANDKLQ